MIGVAAIDEHKHHAQFSQHNPGGINEVLAAISLCNTTTQANRTPTCHHTAITTADVELSAGGVLALSTIRSVDYGHRVIDRSNKNDSAVFIIRQPGPGQDSAPAGVGDPLFSPGPTAFEGSGLTQGLTAAVVDCGAAGGKCQGAAGKVCLIMRENHTDSGQWLCTKVLNCVAGGGVGVLAWPSPSLAGYSDCDQLPGSLITHRRCDRATRYPPALGITRGQGRYLLSLLAAANASTTTTNGSSAAAASTADSSGVTVHIRLLDGAGSSYRNAYGLRSGTSVATPAAAAAAGLVWAAHPECSAAEVRTALAKGALDLGAPGLDEYFGHGLVQIQRSIDYLTQNPCSGTDHHPKHRRHSLRPLFRRRQLKGWLPQLLD